MKVCRTIISNKKKTKTHTHTQPFYGSLDFVRDNPGEPVPEETFTHPHLSLSSVVAYLLYPSIMIHGILPVQFTCLTVFFHNLCPSFLWSTSWPGTLHFILHSVLRLFFGSRFCRQEGYHRYNICCAIVCTVQCCIHVIWLLLVISQMICIYLVQTTGCPVSHHSPFICVQARDDMPHPLV